MWFPNIGYTHERYVAVENRPGLPNTAIVATIPDSGRFPFQGLENAGSTAVFRQQFAIAKYDLKNWIGPHLKSLTPWNNWTTAGLKKHRLIERHDTHLELEHSLEWVVCCQHHAFAINLLKPRSNGLAWACNPVA
jgi:hypothetical protein